MTTIKDYAKDLGISYQSVSKKIKRYSADLEGHIEKKGKQTYLDDFAVRFLNDHSMAAVVIENDKEIEDLQTKLQFLASQLEILQSKNDELNQIKGKVELLEIQNREKDLIIKEHAAELEDLKIRDAVKDKEIEILKDQKRSAEREASSYKKTILGFYRKVDLKIEDEEPDDK